jgi:ABC-type nitrate/sulfonate/bicarbonate transport system substrate-binding protein
MRYGRFLILATVVALLAACAATATETPAPTQQASMAATEVPAATPTPNPFEGKTVKVVVSGDHAFDNVSDGYWVQSLHDAYGLTVEQISTASADLSLRAIVAGAGDFTEATSLTGLLHLYQESGDTVDAKLVVSNAAASDYQILAGSKFATLKDLEGSSQAISGVGGASELAAHICLNLAGIDYSTIQLVQIGTGGARNAAVLSGQVGFTVSHLGEAQDAVAKSNGAVQILADCGKDLGNYPLTGMIASGAWLSANHDLAQVVVGAYIDALRWAASNKDGYLEFAHTWVPEEDPAAEPAVYDYFKQVGFWPVNGGIDLSSLETYLSYATQGGVLVGKIPTTDKWVDDSLVNNYLAANGTQ